MTRRADSAGMVTLDEIPGFAASASLTDADRARERTREVLAVAIDALRVVTDAVAAQAVEVIANELADVAERLTVRELMLSHALQLAFDQHCEITRLRRRVHDLTDLTRASKGAR
jgi:hypothetical protein